MACAVCKNWGREASGTMTEHHPACPLGADAERAKRLLAKLHELRHHSNPAFHLAAVEAAFVEVRADERERCAKVCDELEWSTEPWQDRHLLRTAADLIRNGGG